MTTLSWLHLSDLHSCTPKFSWDAERVTDTLVADLRLLQAEHGLRPDLLFFTGDAAFGEIGTKPEQKLRGQFERFATFLNAVCGAFEPEIVLENVFLVPGNHDVNRQKVSRADTFWLDQQKALDPVLSVVKDGGFEWQRLAERLKNYGSFLKKYKLDHLFDDRKRLIWSTVREVGGLSVGVAGFNSAWSCGRDGERGKLWMAGKYQQGVLRPKIKDADFSIALMHHPPDWLVEYENPDFGRGLEQDFKFLLHGHEHRDWVQSTATGYTVLAGGACYERSDSERNGYNLVQLDLERGKGEVWLRRYESTGGGWIPRIISKRTDNRGVWSLDLDWLRQLGSLRKPRSGRARKKPKAARATPVVETIPAQDPELERYLQRLRAAHRDLPIAGFETSVRMPIRIDPVYIPLRARVMYAATERELRQVGAGRELAEMVAERERDVGFDEALALAREHGLRGAVVLGDPGSGKTTLLKHFVLASTDALIGPATLGLPADTVPVLIELRRLKDPAAGLKAALEQAVASVDVSLDPEAFARRLLAEGRLLVLVDGLDEVADAKTRAEVSCWLEDAIERHLPESTFVVTSRYAGYKGDARLGGRFLELHVRDVEELEARSFIAAWYSAVEARAELGRDAETAAALAKEASSDLVGKIFDPEDARTVSLRALARNPLMLQILCLVHRDRKQLPERRVELYRECVLVLLELWRRAKGMPVDLDAQQALRLLQPLAYWLHSAERREAPLEELLPHLEAPLAELRREPQDGTKLLRAIRDQSGVLVSLGQSAYGFLHLSFQEYLCALHVQDRFASDPEILEALAERFGETWWREVLLLALGLNNPSLFEPLMEELLKRGTLPRDVALADDCLRDALVTTPRPFLRSLAGGLQDAGERYHALRLLRRLQGWKTVEVEGVTGVEVVEVLAREERNREARGMALELLGREALVDLAVKTIAGEEAAGERIHERDGSVLVYVPGGEFTLGTNEGLETYWDEDSRHWPKPEHRAYLSAYWIGKYPVTNEQYSRFLAANPEHGEPELWEEKEFNQPQQPVVGVSWLDAKAYCAWAGLVLPSEAQWEAAARGTDGRPYPWGEDAPSETRANFDSREGRTSPVDAYPAGAGPYGTLDQAGNVWEWCLDEFDEQAYRDRDGQEDPVVKPKDESSEAADRVVRGGSWANPSQLLHSAFRVGVRAGVRLQYLGFRVCQFGPERCPHPAGSQSRDHGALA